MSARALRQATSADAEAVAALEHDIFGTDAWSVATVRDELGGCGRVAVVALEGEAVVGYAVLRETADGADLHRVAVAGPCRRDGLAGRLLDALDLAGYPSVLLEVRADNAAALGFYRVRGFTQVGRRPRYYADGQDAVVMRL